LVSVGEALRLDPWAIRDGWTYPRFWMTLWCLHDLVEARTAEMDRQRKTQARASGKGGPFGRQMSIGDFAKLHGVKAGPKGVTSGG